MPEYLVEWRIEIWAETPRYAAEVALAIQRDSSSTAVVFDVTAKETGEEFQIDLLKENDND